MKKVSSAKHVKLTTLGFTLIELLAVIIILAVIALIATPIILNVVDEAKEKARVSSVYGYSEAVILTNAENQLETDKIDLKVGASSKMKGDAVTCKTVVFSDNYGAILDECTVGSNDKLYYFDGSKVYTERPTDMDDRLANANKPVIGDYKDNSGASVPELADKMLPVTYNGTDWVYADKTTKWYDYNNKEWANAVILNNDVTKTVGQTIAESEIAMMYVWVPRYEYILPTASLGITGTPNAIDIKFIDKDKTEADSGYSLHPGFTFGGVNQNGLWYGKFEASTTGGATTNAVQTITIKPNVASWRNVTPYNMFTSSQNITTDYSLTGVDTHMARYLEWTTASYLTNSIYGRCDSATSCMEVTINNSSDYITGNAGNTVSASSAAGVMNAYNTPAGQLASTTGNITGIYDMSGGAWEYVMGFLEGQHNYNSYSGFVTLPDSKYYDTFTSTATGTSNYSVLSQVNGTANMNGVFKELLGSNTTSTTGWYGDFANFVNASSPWFLMGGRYGNTTNAGVLGSSISDGSTNSNYSFRAILTIN